MNPTDWSYHLNLRTALREHRTLDTCSPAGRRRERLPSGVRRAAAAGLALLVPALLASVAILAG